MKRRAVHLTLLGILVAAALSVRLPQALGGSLLDAQEIRYVGLAENLAAGGAFGSAGSRYPDIMQPPLYPILAAAAASVTGSPAAAARGVSAILGALVVVPLFRLGRKLHCRAAGYGAGLIAAFHPGLVGNARLALTEPAYIFLLLWGVATSLGALRHPERAGRAAGASALLSLAYLTRPEGLVYVGLFVSLLAVVLASRRLRAGAGRAGDAGDAEAARARPLWMSLAAGSLAATVLVGGYAFWVHARSGIWSFAPKGRYAMELVARREALDRAGVRLPNVRLYERIRFELDETGDEFSVRPLPPPAEARSDAVRVREETAGARPSLGYLIRFAAGNAVDAYRLIASTGEILPPIVAVALGMGLASLVARGRGGWALAYLLLSSATGWTFVLTHVLSRFLLPSAALLLPLAGAGIAQAAAWARAPLERRPATRRAARPGAFGAAAGLVVAALFLHLGALRGPGGAVDADLARAGAWVRETAPAKPLVMGITEVPAWYARAGYLPVPYAPPEAALRFARLKGATHLVLERNETAAMRPDLVSLLDRGSRRFEGGGGEWEAVWSDPHTPPFKVAVLAPVSGPAAPEGAGTPPPR